MPSVTYAQAAALAQRLDACRRNGATLLLDTGHQLAEFRFGENCIMFKFGRASALGIFYHWALDGQKSPDEFEAHWRGRITVLRENAWPTGETHTADERIRQAVNETLERAAQACAGLQVSGASVRYADVVRSFKESC